MVSFQIIPNFFQDSYEPGKRGKIGVSIINSGRDLFFLRKIGMQFDWQDKTRVYTITANLPIQPRRRYGLKTILFGVPLDVTGLHTFKFFADFIRFDPVLEINYKKRMWTNNGEIIIRPTPRYRVFISRSIKRTDRRISDPIVNLIRAWSIQPVTVGINVKGSEDPKKLEKIIVNEIKKSDGIICIATKRDRTVDGKWKTSAWVHTEVGISLYPDKQCLVLYDEDVTLEGAIWGKLKIPLNILDYDETEYKVNHVMSYYRDWIKQKKNDELIKTIGKIMVTAIGAYGIYSIGKEAGRREMDYYG